MGDGIRQYYKDYKKLYNTKRWKQLRAEQLRKHPYCQCQHHIGRKHPANVVDHKTPHKGDLKLFYDRSNLQSMSKECHDKFKQSQERGGAGFNQGCDINGNPLSKEHDWWK